MTSFDTRGYVLGLLVYVVTIVVLYVVRFAFFTERHIVQGIEVSSMAPGPIVQWLMVGALPLCLALGQYLAVRNEAGTENRAYKILMASLFAFIIWLAVVTVAQYAGISIPFIINVLGGYLLLLVTLVIIKLRGNRSFSGSV